MPSRIIVHASWVWLLAAILLAAPEPVRAQSIPVTDGLAGYWPAEGNTDDLSGNANHGTALGGLGYAPGRFGQAFALDGVDDLVRVGADSTLDATGPFSIAAWVRRAEAGAYHTIVDRGLGVSDPDSSYTLRIETDDQLRFEWEQGGTNASTTSGVKITDSDWHHVAGVFDGTENTVYIDGVPLAPSATSLDPTVTEQSFQIGARLRSGPSFDLHFYGWIDEVAFYDRALTPQEVALLAVPEIPVTGPVGLVVLGALLAIAFQLHLRLRLPASRPASPR